MPFVLDASIAACWAFDGDDHPTALLAVNRVRTDAAWLEVRNTLIVQESSGRLAEKHALLTLAHRHRLSPLQAPAQGTGTPLLGPP